MVEINGIVDNSLIEQAVNDTSIDNQLDGSSFDPNMFLRILMAELQNQDPFNTADSGQILEQQALLTEVEQSARQSGIMESLESSITENFTLLNQSLDEIKQLLNEG